MVHVVMGGDKGVERAEYLFCMDIRGLLRVCLEMWLDQEVKTRGEVYTCGLRIPQLACHSLWDCKGNYAWQCWSIEEQKAKPGWHKVYQYQNSIVQKQRCLLDFTKTAPPWVCRFYTSDSSDVEDSLIFLLLVVRS